MDSFIEITNEQKEFLKKYPYPWSFLGKKRESFNLPSFMNEIEYAKISLRVAKNCIKPEYIPGIKMPLFLTSARLS